MEDKLKFWQHIVVWFYNLNRKVCKKLIYRMHVIRAPVSQPFRVQALIMELGFKSGVDNFELLWMHDDLGRLLKNGL